MTSDLEVDLGDCEPVETPARVVTISDKHGGGRNADLLDAIDYVIQKRSARSRVHATELLIRESPGYKEWQKSTKKE